MALKGSTPFLLLCGLWRFVRMGEGVFSDSESICFEGIVMASFSKRCFSSFTVYRSFFVSLSANIMIWKKNVQQ